MSYLLPAISIVLIFLMVEVVLEVRHYLKGYETLLLPSPSATSLKEESVAGDVDFPFRSQYVEPSELRSEKVLWIASASHAEHSRFRLEQLFPNQICKFSKQGSCFVINGSKAGYSIAKDIVLLDAHSTRYVPNFILLYQMSQEIEKSQRLAATFSGRPDNEINSLIDLKPLKELFQQSSIYGHLNEFVTGTVRLEGHLNDHLPSHEVKRFKQEIISFIRWARAREITPVLSTFAAAYNLENAEQLPYKIQLQFVRYNAYLTPDAWINTIDSWNQILKDIAQEEDLSLIDIAAFVGGKPEFFIDFVHFNEKGHAKVAKVIAEEMDKIWSDHEADHGF